MWKDIAAVGLAATGTCCALVLSASPDDAHGATIDSCVRAGLSSDGLGITGCAQDGWKYGFYSVSDGTELGYVEGPHKVVRYDNSELAPITKNTRPTTHTLVTPKGHTIYVWAYDPTGHNGWRWFTHKQDVQNSHDLGHTVAYWRGCRTRTSDEGDRQTQCPDGSNDFWEN